MSNKRTSTERDEPEQAEHTLPTPRTPTRIHQKRARMQELHDAPTPPPHLAIARSLFFQIIEDIDEEETRINDLNREIDGEINGIIQKMPETDINSP